MRLLKIGAIFMAVSASALATDALLTYAKAKNIWEASRESKEYQSYSEEFAQFNNHFRLDEKDGCYALEQGAVELMLVITHDGKSQYATIEQVLPSVENAKSTCFVKSYGGISTKIPPFLPFVLQMGMQ